MESEKIRADLLGFLQRVYPRIDVRVGPSRHDPARLEIQFIEESFRGLYPKQRYHSLVHLIPSSYYDAHLANTLWVELAPGESEVDALDEATISSITPDVMACLSAKSFFESLDDLLSPVANQPDGKQCVGDFGNSKLLLSKLGFADSDFANIFEVLMSQGAFCDCEILYNVAESSRLKADYWRARVKGITRNGPHKRT